MKINPISAFLEWYKRKKTEKRFIDAFLSDSKSINGVEKLCEQITSSLTSEELCYKQIEAINLTSGELRAGILPDSCLDSVVIEFTSKGGRSYWACHAHQQEGILLSSNSNMYDSADESDFKRVEKIIMRETKGKLKYHLTNKKFSIKDYINLRKRPTQAMVADFIERYAKHFIDIKIIACFKDVPKSFYENLGLPVEKIIVRQDYCQY